MSIATTDQSLSEFRAEMFTEMGFSEEQAGSLAEGKEDTGYPLDIHRVRKMVNSGCSHDLVLKIVL